MTQHILTILAVDSLARAAEFYDAAFGWPRRVDVPVYVEYALPDGRGLGVYQRDAFGRNTGVRPAAVPESAITSTELYFHCADLDPAIARMLRAGARVLSERAPRDWGDEAAYFADPEGNVIVLARPLAVPDVQVRELSGADREWLARETERLWGGAVVISRGRAHAPASLPGFVAYLDGERAGVATFRVDGPEAELVTIDAFEPRRGVGSALLGAVELAVAAAGGRRVWLVTTNDNLGAVRFYQRRGYALAALHPGAIADSRRLKPTIPATGTFGIPIRDELVLEKALG
ncbi:MAG: GNAT family N-acetyltransferase [Candidatus Sericytochromatia bacterium]|nr:GNAT family N-acetyltransferase [Candidatus Tanganyikabacteria bacterium]